MNYNEKRTVVFDIEELTHIEIAIRELLFKIRNKNGFEVSRGILLDISSKVNKELDPLGIKKTLEKGSIPK